MDLDRSLYGLKQAPRNWFKLLTDFIMEQLGFERCSWDHCLFISKSKPTVCIFVYVDDLLVFAENGTTIQLIVTKLKEHYNMKDLGGIDGAEE